MLASKLYRPSNVAVECLGLWAGSLEKVGLVSTVDDEVGPDLVSSAGS